MRNIAAVKIALMAAILLVSCSQVPDGVLKPGKMADVLTDIHKGDAIVETNSRPYQNDSLKNVLRQSILKKHKIDQATLDSSIVWYSRNMKLYVEVYDKVLENLDNELADARVTSVGLKKSISQTSRISDGDSVNVWTGAPSARFAYGSASEFINFHLNSDRGWEDGDSYHLSAVAIGLTKDSPRTIVVEYSDGTVEYVSDSPASDGRHTTDIYLDPNKKALRLYGSIRVPVSAGQTVFLDSITLTRERLQPMDSVRRRGQTLLKKTN